MAEAPTPQLLPKWPRPALRQPQPSVLLQPRHLAGLTIPADAPTPADGVSPTEPPVVSLGPEPRLSVVIAPPARESNLPRELATQNLLRLRLALESLVDIDRFTGEYIPMLDESWESPSTASAGLFLEKRASSFITNGESFSPVTFSITWTC